MTRTATTSPPTEKAEAVQLDRVYPHPPAQVWQALTDPRRLGKWLLPSDFAPRLGHRFTFRDGRRDPIHAEVIALDEARRLAYTWRRGQEPLSVVTWTLEPVGEHATRVRLTHTGSLSRRAVSAFWMGALGRLPRALRPSLFLLAPKTARRRKSVFQS